MKLRKVAFSLLLAGTFSLVSIASTPTNFLAEANTTTKSVVQEIKSKIQKIDFNFERLDQTTVKVKFMVNSDHELIVISTDVHSIDKTLKSALNYEKVNTEGLQLYHVYIVPITFEAT